MTRVRCFQCRRPLSVRIQSAPFHPHTFSEWSEERVREMDIHRSGTPFIFASHSPKWKLFISRTLSSARKAREPSEMERAISCQDWCERMRCGLMLFQEHQSLSHHTLQLVRSLFRVSTHASFLFLLSSSHLILFLVTPLSSQDLAH